MNTLKVAKGLKFSVLIFVSAIFFGCGNAEQSKDANPAPAEQPLNFGVEVENTYMRTTGEVIVFFEPSEQRLAVLKESTPAITANLEAFKAFKQKAIEFLKEKKLNYTESNQDDVRLAVTETQVNIINVANVPEGFGVVIGRLGKQPQILRGITSFEEFTSKVSADQK